MGSHESSDRHNIRTGKELIEEGQDRPRWQTRPGSLRAHRGVLTRGSCQQPPSRLRMANNSRCERLRRTPADRRSGLGSRSPSWVSTSITTMAASSRNECPHPAFAAIRTRNVSRLAADSRCECTYRESAARGWTRSPPPISPTWENAWAYGTRDSGPPRESAHIGSLLPADGRGTLRDGRREPAARVMPADPGEGRPAPFSDH